MLLEASGYLPATILGRAPALPWRKFFQWGVTQLYIWWAFTPLVALDYYRKYRDREYRLVQAQLQTLKAQLQPHFLFNTLNSISTLMHEDVETADRMVVSLGDLLRATLGETGGQEVTLRRELEVLDLYLRIQLIRFQNRLKVNTDVDPEALDACVPNLVLQPLAENAVKHGIAPHSVDGVIDIGARRDGASLLLTVRDDGPGLREPRQALREGVGLSNTRARLERLYGAAQNFEYGDAARGGFEVELRIPFRRAAEGVE